jgi:hypothetical protein
MEVGRNHQRSCALVSFCVIVVGNLGSAATESMNKTDLGMV